MTVNTLPHDKFVNCDQADAGVPLFCDVLAGRPEAARARLLPLLDRPGLEECDVMLLLPVLAWAHLERGQVDKAPDAVGQALARAQAIIETGCFSRRHRVDEAGQRVRAFFPIDG